MEFLDDVPMDDILVELGEKVQALLASRKQLEFLADKMKEEAEKEKALSQEEIPNLVLSRGLSEIKLATGEKVIITEGLFCGVPKDPIKKRIVLKWLSKNQGEHLIKREVTVEEPEEHILKYLKDKGIPFIDQMNVNTGSLKAFLSAQLGMKKGSLQVIELGEIPSEANPFVLKKTKIK